MNSNINAGDIVREYDALKDFTKKLSKFYVREGQITKEAKEYLEYRGLNQELCTSLGIGYAPFSERTLEFLRINSIPESYLVNAGVFIKKEGGVFDLFYNRIIFSLKDPFNDVVGFSGRIYKSDQQSLSKYVNSTSSILFQKSLLLYNLSLAIPHIQRLGYCVLVEGMMDVIAFLKSGVYNVVAPCGTSLTTEQAKILRLYTKNVVTCYDNDEGGRESLPRITTLLFNEGITPHNISIFNEGEDPEDFIKKYSVTPILSFISSLSFA
ncbi:MAG: toprim domain-containing protein [Novosphingobium sp.]|nr:toprim domain-containing protein [Novosphingobium sp.]